MSNKFLFKISIVLSIILTIFLVGLTLHPASRQVLLDFSTQNIVFTYIFIVVFNIISIVVAPVSSAVVNIFFIPYVGWLANTFLVVLGDMIGYVIAFALSRKYREKIVGVFISLKKIHAWENELNDSQKFWSLFLIRISTQVVGDFVTYIAGLTKLSFKIFFLATLLSEIIIQFSRFYLAHLGFTIHPAFFLTLLIPFGLGTLFYKNYLRKNKLKDLE